MVDTYIQHSDGLMSSNTSPSMLTNTLLIANFELRKLFFQRRGLVALLCFTLVWLLILLYPIKGAADLMSMEGFRGFLSLLSGSNTANEIINWPVAEMAVYWTIALFLFPLFSLILTADQYASDKQRGTLRFLLLRAQRDSVYFGRFLAQVLIQSLLILISVLTTIILVAYRETDLLIPAFINGLFLSLALIINVLPFTALMGVFSLYAKGPQQASILAVLLLAVISILISIINYLIPQTEIMNMLKPSVQLFDMVNIQSDAVLSYSLLPLIQTIAILTFGRFYIQRKAL